MATERQVEAAAREMFSLSWGARLGLWHWPGEEPREVSALHSHLVNQTMPADDPSAPDGGKGPEKLRQMAQRILDAAEAARYGTEP